MSVQPDIQITYEDGRYTAIITWNDNTVITDGKTLDELFASMQDAFSCHFHQDTPAYSIDLSIPTIHFVYNPLSSHASVS